MGTASNSLPETFTFRQAIAAGLTRHEIYRLHAQGRLERIARGVYHRPEASWGSDIDLIEIALRAKDATLCLTSALARHGLTDQIPACIDIALPRGRWRPVTSAPVSWHSFDTATFCIGRETLSLEGSQAIGVYSPERCIIDAFRLRHREDPELAISAAKKWLRLPGHHPATLLEMATHFPKTLPSLRTALETILA